MLSIPKMVLAILKGSEGALSVMEIIAECDSQYPELRKKYQRQALPNEVTRILQKRVSTALNDMKKRGEVIDTKEDDELDEEGYIEFEGTTLWMLDTLHSDNRTDLEISAAQEEAFETYGYMLDQFWHGDINALMVTGASGIGKSFLAMEEMEKRGIVPSKGRMTGVKLFETLYLNQNKVVVLDDIDVTSDINTLNVLKAALDTTGKCIISWKTYNESLMQLMGAETVEDMSFEFEGKILFLSNIHIEKEMRSARLGVHIKALCSRSDVLDLGVNTMREIKVFCLNKLKEPEFTNGYSEEAVQFATRFINEPTNNLRTLSLREVNRLMDLYVKNPDMAEQNAKVLMNKRG